MQRLGDCRAGCCQAADLDSPAVRARCVGKTPRSGRPGPGDSKVSNIGHTGRKGSDTLVAGVNLKAAALESGGTREGPASPHATGVFESRRGAARARNRQPGRAACFLARQRVARGARGLAGLPREAGGHYLAESAVAGHSPARNSCASE